MTLFSKIINREIPAQIVYEDELALAFRDISPKAPTHILVIPKKEIASTDAIEKTDENLIGHLVWVAAEVARKEGIAKSGYRLIINSGADAGQEVPHIHIHLIGGRKLSWPPG